MKKNIVVFFACVFFAGVLSGCGGKVVESQFPLPETVENFVQQDMGDSVIFQTDLEAEAALAFYLNALSEQGYTERELLTVYEKGTFSTVFDGHEKGAIVVQGVTLPEEGRTNITIRIEDI